MDKTQFAGLTRLDPGDPLSEDNFSFQSDNPRVIDRFLELGAVSHRHDAHAPLANPTADPVANAVASGGSIAAGVTIYVGYTLHDADQGETILSPIATVTTELPMDAPASSPTATMDYTGGTLTADTYYYAVSLLDASGGETPLGPTVSVTRDPGTPNAQAVITGLAQMLADSGATSWRLWRAVGGGDFFHMGDGATDTFTDDGIVCADCSLAPVDGNNNLTNGDNSVVINIPSSPELEAATAFSIYVSEDATFAGPSLLATLTIDQAGVDQTYTELVVEDRRPPDVATSVPGAAKIDPETELLNFHWRAPVANAAALPAGATAGDVRITLDDGAMHVFHGGAWAAVGGGGGGGGAASLSNPLGTTIDWTDPNGTVVQLVGQERRDDRTTLAGGPWVTDPDGTAEGTGYAASGGLLVPVAGGNNLDHVNSYGPGQAKWGHVERGITFNDNGWLRLGVGVAAGQRAVVAQMRNDGVTAHFEIAYRIDTTNAGANNDLGWVTIVGAALPALPAAADYYWLQLEHLRNSQVAATLWDGNGNIVAQLGPTPMPAELAAYFGDTGSVVTAKYAALADRWTAETSWSTDALDAVSYDYHRELRAKATSIDSTVVERKLLDDLGLGASAVGPLTGTLAADYANLSEAQLWQDPQGPVRLRGKLVKDGGTAPAAGDVLLTLDPSLVPNVTRDVEMPVVTGDSDGVELGMVRLNTAGELVWLAGRSTDPATKHPYVSVDGLFYLPPGT